MFPYFMDVSASLFQSFLIVDFILKFNGINWKKCTYAPVFTALHFAVAVIGDFFAPGFNLFITGTSFVQSILFALLVCRRHPGSAILSACIYKTVHILIGSFTYSVMSAILDDFDSLMQGEDGAPRYLYIIICNLLLFAILKLILHLFSYKENADKKTGLTAFLMTSLTLVGLGTTMSLAEAEFISRIAVQIVILTCIFILSNVVLYLLIHQLQQLQKVRYEMQLLKDQMNFEESRHNDAIAIWDNIRKVQHDIKQHLTVIQCQLEEGKLEECKQYVGDLIPATYRMGTMIQSGNMVLDYLINSKLCPLDKTQVVISGSVANLSDIRDIDLACIIGNILDNAIEAISDLSEKRIELIFTNQNSTRVIICKNTIGQSVLKTNKELASTKPGGHGYGHIIVDKIVERYNGMVGYFEEGDMFGVQIMLPRQEFSVRP